MEKSKNQQKNQTIKSSDLKGFLMSGLNTVDKLLTRNILQKLTKDEHREVRLNVETASIAIRMALHELNSL